MAAVFGLVPAQLFAGLQRQSERFKLELEKSEPSGGSSLSGSTSGWPPGRPRPTVIRPLEVVPGVCRRAACA